MKKSININVSGGNFTVNNLLQGESNTVIEPSIKGIIDALLKELECVRQHITGEEYQIKIDKNIQDLGKFKDGDKNLQNMKDALVDTNDLLKSVVSLEKNISTTYKTLSPYLKNSFSYIKMICESIGFSV